MGNESPTVTALEVDAAKPARCYRVEHTMNVGADSSITIAVEGDDINELYRYVALALALHGFDVEDDPYRSCFEDGYRS